MGKPFQQEIQQLSQTYIWARREDVGELSAALLPLQQHSLLVVGSGGSLSAAHLTATLHEMRTGNLARVCTPLELAGNAQTAATMGIVLLSAGGKNPDILNALSEAFRMEPPWTTVICGTRSTPLAKLARSQEFGSVYDYSVPVEKDGFLATNSLLAFFTLILRSQLPSASELPNTLEEVMGAPDALTFLEKSSQGELAAVVARETLLVLYGASTKSAAIDLESKLTEAALARVQLADFRNFAHGRHHWLAKRASESAVVAFCAPEDMSLCRRTLESLPREVPRVAGEPGGKGAPSRGKGASPPKTRAPPPETRAPRPGTRAPRR